MAEHTFIKLPQGSAPWSKPGWEVPNAACYDAMPVCLCGEPMVWQCCYACPGDQPIGVMHGEDSHCPGPGGYWLCRACNPSLWDPADGALVWHARKKKPPSVDPVLDQSMLVLDLSAGKD